MLRKSSSLVRLAVSALITASAAAAAGPSTQFPTYTVGKQADGSYVLSTGQIITPAGTVIDLTQIPSSVALNCLPFPGNIPQLGIPLGSFGCEAVRAKAVALDPLPASSNGHHFAAVLLMGATSAVDLIDLDQGAVVQAYVPFSSASGSFTGITYTPDGKHLLFSQDNSNLVVADVDPAARTFSDNTRVPLPASTADIDCSGIDLGLPSDPVNGLCGHFYTNGTSNPAGVAVSSDSKTAYVILNQNNTLQAVDLSNAATKGAVATKGAAMRVGNAPNTVVVDGRYAYISNEGGRVAIAGDFTGSSSGTPIVASREHGDSATGTISVVDTTTGSVVADIETGGLHPTGLTLAGGYLFVANTASDNIGVIDLATRRLERTISVALPLAAPREAGAGHDPSGHAFGAQPTSLAVVGSVAYVTLYTANAIAVVDLSGAARNPVLGYIPTASTPSSIAYDPVHRQLVLTNDKGLGAQSFETTSYLTVNASTYQASDSGFNTHADQGAVSLIPLPDPKTLGALSTKVAQNNHWDLRSNIESAGGGNPFTPPVAIPRHIGDPSLIKHVFLIVRENRTYDQVLGDVKTGNGSAPLAVFAPFAPNVHALVKRFPLLDNYYDPSRQSADGHNWLVQAMAPYEDEIQSPDWIRSYPANGQDVMAYQPKGFVWDAAEEKGLNVKIYGEYVEYAGTTYNNPDGTHNEPSWTQFYSDALAYESGKAATLTYATTVNTTSEIPSVQTRHLQHFPPFDLGIPDQWRVDLWQQDFAKDVKSGNVPALETLWIMCDHTGGPPSVAAEQADNDLAVGRIIDIISHSPVWKDSVIFVTEDDSQDGVDHVDGHRSPGYVVSPYVEQAAPDGAPVVSHTAYTQVNFTRTIEQILGLPPMNQFDLVASPLYDLFTDHPAPASFLPWDHVAQTVPLCIDASSATGPNGDMGSPLAGFTINGVNCTISTTATARNFKKPSKLEKQWKLAAVEMFKGKQHIPDSEDPVVVNHWNWYEATGYSRPYPGEDRVLSPKDFGSRIKATRVDDDD